MNAHASLLGALAIGLAGCSLLLDPRAAPLVPDGEAGADADSDADSDIDADADADADVDADADEARDADPDEPPDSEVDAPPPRCDDGAANGEETDVDCGGPCPPCGHGLRCATSADCRPWGLCVADRCDVFGDGRDGPLDLDAPSALDPVRSSASAVARSRHLVVSASASFTAGQRVLVHQTRGPDAGHWEEQIVVSAAAGEITVQDPLLYTYVSSGESRAQVLVLRQHTKVIVRAGATLAGPRWDGRTGGILALKASDEIRVEPGGAIAMDAAGYRGHARPEETEHTGEQGEGHLAWGARSVDANGSGGGGGGQVDGGERHEVREAGGGGGGGHAAPGQAGVFGSAIHVQGAGGRATGGAHETWLLPGGAGGSGGADEDGYGGRGGNGGGIVFLAGPTVSCAGGISAAGEPGDPAYNFSGWGSGAGGGGAGGTVLIVASWADLGTGLVTALGGAGGADRSGAGHEGGAGAEGRVFAVADSLFGASLPAATALPACPDMADCPGLAVSSCRELPVLRPGAVDGAYWIDPDRRGAIEVFCDLTSDGGAGHTLLRVDDAIDLGNAQAAYLEVCRQLGLEVVVPRTVEHAVAIAVWNSGVVPNLVNVVPSRERAVGLSNWQGLCRGAPCSFWLSSTDDASCVGASTPDGDNDAESRLYRFGDPCVLGLDYGSWNDDLFHFVQLPGWVICSTNDPSP